MIHIKRGKMSTKNLSIFAVFALLAVFASLNFVSAETTAFLVTSPANNANLSGTTTVNVTLTAYTTTNVTVRVWNGTSGAWLIVGSNSSNSSNANLSFAFSVDTTVYSANLSSAIFNVTSVETGGIAANSSNQTGLVIDNTAPTILQAVSGNFTNGTYQNNSQQIAINFSVVLARNMTTSAACRININGTNQTIPITVQNTTFGTCNTTVANLTGATDGNKTIYLYVNNSAGLVGVNSQYVVFVDSNGPTVELSLASSSSDTLTLNIATSDGTGTGVNSCTVDREGATVSGTTSLSESGLNCATDYTYTVTCTDRNGHSASVAETFSTNSCGGGGSSGSGGASSASPVVKTVTGTNSISVITPGAASIVKDFSSEIGVKQIEINVNNKAQDVKVTVTKYDGKPAAVSVAKSGDVKQYLQINVQNVQDKLSSAKVQFRVEKAKVSNKNGIVVSKFDETAKQWNDLATTFSSEDSTYYYYDVALTSFSYFAISEKATTTATGTTRESGTTAEGRSMTWLWWVLGVVVVVLVAWLLMRKK